MPRYCHVSRVASLSSRDVHELLSALLLSSVQRVQLGLKSKKRHLFLCLSRIGGEERAMCTLSYELLKMGM